LLKDSQAVGTFEETANMSDNTHEIEHMANRALEKAESTADQISALGRNLKGFAREMYRIRDFNRKLLGILKFELKINDSDLVTLSGYLKATEEPEVEAPGRHLAPLCQSCQRPLLGDCASCIYCGIPVGGI
jgi:hypothetical protein